MTAVALRWLRLNLTTVVLWLLVVAGMTALYVPLYRRYESEGLFRAGPLPDGVSEALHLEALATPAGFLGATILGPLGLLVLLIAGIGLGAGAVAGDEEAGMLELTLSRGVSRFWAYVGRWLACSLVVIGLGAALTAMVSLAVWLIKLPIAPTRVIAAGSGLTLVAGLFSALALGLGAATGRSGFAKVTSSSLAFAAFIMHALNTRWVQFSPVHWALSPPPLEHGLAVAPALLLVVGGLLCGLLGLILFLGRDVGRSRVDSVIRP